MNLLSLDVYIKACTDIQTS